VELYLRYADVLGCEAAPRPKQFVCVVVSPDAFRCAFLCPVRFCSPQACLLQVGAQDLDKPLGGTRAVGAWLGVRAENVVAEFALHEFAHQTVDGAAAGGNLLQNRGALVAVLQRPLDGLHLTTDTARPAQEAIFILLYVRQRYVPSIDQACPVGSQVNAPSIPSEPKSLLTTVRRSAVVTTY
jgi:hypothetical protein